MKVSSIKDIMKIKWLIEKCVMDESLIDSMVEGAKESGAETKVMYTYEESQDFLKDLYLDISNGYSVIPYGSIGFIKKIQNTSVACVSSIWFNQDNLSWVKFSANWIDHVLNKDHAIMTLGALRQNKEKMYRSFGTADEIFAKPCKSDKMFAGRKVNIKDFDQFFTTFGYKGNVRVNADPAALIVVSSPKDVKFEWRFVICDRKIAGCSRYFVDRKINKEEGCKEQGAIDLVGQILRDKWQPDEVYIMDICKIGNEFRLLELGSFNCCNLYECNGKEVAKIITEKVGKNDKI